SEWSGRAEGEGWGAAVAGREERRAGIRGQRGAIALVRPGEHVEHEGGVAHGAGHGTRDREIAPAGKAGPVRNASEGRLEAVDAAERRGNANGTTAVRAEGERA